MQIKKCLREFAAIVIMAIPMFALAQVQSGTYTGTISCGELLGEPSSPGWTDKVQVEINGSQLTWSRMEIGRAHV